MLKLASIGKKLHTGVRGSLKSANVVKGNEKNNGANSVERLLPFEDIPGPRSYPVIGTLHKYLPFIGT